MRITRKDKITIGKIIKKLQMQKVENPSAERTVKIPSSSFSVSEVQFNKIWDVVNKGKK